MSRPHNPLFIRNNVLYRVLDEIIRERFGACVHAGALDRKSPKFIPALERHQPRAIKRAPFMVRLLHAVHGECRWMKFQTNSCNDLFITDVLFWTSIETFIVIFYSQTVIWFRRGLPVLGFGGHGQKGKTRLIEFGYNMSHVRHRNPALWLE